MQVFAAVTALCGIIALSKVNIDTVHAEIEFVTASSELRKYSINTSTLVCGSLFLLTCGGTLLYEIIILIKSIVSKDQNTKVLSIVVSQLYNIIINPNLCTHSRFIMLDLQETVLGSISAVVFFSLAIALANSANEYASFIRDLGRSFPGARVQQTQHPLIMPDQATAVSYSLNYY